MQCGPPSNSSHLFQSCELLLLSKLGWDVYLDCEQEAVEQLDNLMFTNKD